jgi:hypothetical protein
MVGKSPKNKPAKELSVEQMTVLKGADYSKANPSSFVF